MPLNIATISAAMQTAVPTAVPADAAADATPFDAVLQQIADTSEVAKAEPSVQTGQANTVILLATNHASAGESETAPEDVAANDDSADIPSDQTAAAPQQIAIALPSEMSNSAAASPTSQKQSAIKTASPMLSLPLPGSVIPTAPAADKSAPAETAAQLSDTTEPQAIPQDSGVQADKSANGTTILPVPTIVAATMLLQLTPAAADQSTADASASTEVKVESAATGKGNGNARAAPLNQDGASVKDGGSGQAVTSAATANSGTPSTASSVTDGKAPAAAKDEDKFDIQNAATEPAATVSSSSGTVPASAAGSPPDPSATPMPAATSPAVAPSPPATSHAAGSPAELQVVPHHEFASTTTADKLGLVIAAKSVDGVRQFDIRLDPPELGRVQVQLALDDTGKAQVNLVVDKPQTLELLQRDAANLNRTLTDAGLNLPNNGLNFTLREQYRQNDGGSVDKGRGRPLSVTAVVQPDASQTLASITSSAPYSVRLDVRV